MTQQITWNSDDPNMSYLENNGFVKDTNNNLFVVDRKNGYMLSLFGINESFSIAGTLKGKLIAHGCFSVNVDPSSSEYDSENEYFTHEINGYSTFYELLKSKK